MLGSALLSVFAAHTSVRLWLGAALGEPNTLRAWLSSPQRSTLAVMALAVLAVAATGLWRPDLAGEAQDAEGVPDPD